MNPGLFPSSDEKGILNQVAGQLTSRKAALASELHQALRARDMSNRMLISPSRLEEIAQEEVEPFLHFLETGDEEETRQRGARRASEGLGERSALANLDREALRVAFEASGRYVNAFLEGYMSGREEEILKEQERTRHAFQRVLEKQAHS
jgi:hypothetical protein